MISVLREAEISGHIFWNDRMQKGTLKLDGDTPVFSRKTPNFPKLEGTLIPAPFNAHVHTADSFITEEPPSELFASVGPGGFKHAALGKATASQIESGIRRAIEAMETTGTFGFCDFREGGASGARIASGIRSNLVKVILGRPGSVKEIDEVLSVSDGIALSSLPDTDEEMASLSSERTHRAKKIFALHLSEAVREDAIAAISLRPDFLVHCGYCSDSDLEAIRKEDISVAITPRSNAFYGLRVDYGRLLRFGINVLLGTDNGMVSRPDLFAEMSFLYLSSKNYARMDPEKIISMATTNWHNVFPAVSRKLESSFLLFRSRMMTPYEVVMRSSGEKVFRIKLKE